VQQPRGALLAVAGALFGAGVASAVTALGTYFIRYSSFDSIEGEVSLELYVAITRMAVAEKAALALGGVLVVISLALLVWNRNRLSRRSA
jgi:hypothetical protein